MSRSIRIDEKTYRKLCEEAGKLQARFKRPVSIDEAIWHLMKMPKVPNRISDLAGAWDVTNEEVELITRSLSEGWRRWRQPESA